MFLCLKSLRSQHHLCLKTGIVSVVLLNIIGMLLSGHGGEAEYHCARPTTSQVWSKTKGQRIRDVEEIGAGSYKGCDVGHPSPTVERGQIGIESDTESTGSTTRKGFGQDGRRSCLIEG